jgi:hypothetical protein
MIARHVVSLTLAALLSTAALASFTAGEPARDGALVELQSGPVTLMLGGPGGVRLKPEPCLRTGCPLLRLRLPSSAAAFQGAPGETGRVQRLQPAHFQSGRLAAQPAGDVLSQERRVGEATRAKPT